MPPNNFNTTRAEARPQIAICKDMLAGIDASLKDPDGLSESCRRELLNERRIIKVDLGRLLKLELKEGA